MVISFQSCITAQRVMLLLSRTRRRGFRSRIFKRHSLASASGFNASGTECMLVPPVKQMTAPAIRTTVVGSYPVPDWLVALPSEQALIDATRVVFKTQEMAGD